MEIIMTKKKLIDFGRMLTIASFLLLVLVTALSTLAGGDSTAFSTLNVGDSVIVICNDGYIQADHTIPSVRPTPTNVSYPSPYPAPQFQTSVGIYCYLDEVRVLDIYQKLYIPIVEKNNGK